MLPSLVSIAVILIGYVFGYVSSVSAVIECKNMITGPDGRIVETTIEKTPGYTFKRFPFSIINYRPSIYALFRPIHELDRRVFRVDAWKSKRVIGHDNVVREMLKEL